MISTVMMFLVFLATTIYLEHRFCFNVRQIQSIIYQQILFVKHQKLEYIFSVWMLQPNWTYFPMVNSGLG